MAKITHIFFDIGSTLVDETECYNHRIHDMIAGTGITFEQFSVNNPIEQPDYTITNLTELKTIF